jgi:hypothetical protein
MTPSRSRVRIDRIDLDLVYYTLHMSMGKRVRERQPEMWVATTSFPTAASHPFYTLLNQRLAEHSSMISSKVSVNHSMRKSWDGVAAIGKTEVAASAAAVGRTRPVGLSYRC